MGLAVENLKMNFKTMEEFKSFKEYGLEELSMIEELQTSMVEDNTDSPFYGIYYGDRLAARMCLYIRQDTSNLVPGNDQYVEIWKLEVLPAFQKKGLGALLVQFAKSFELPIMTKPRVKSQSFWEKVDFKPVSENSTRLIWLPEKKNAQKTS
ncbi:GNAT family N-acetyltransferase [Domibacillus sp. PGB-M46]|uniref:GNAT family N-acetyltransferase n=1 Tax=Domibacillus sp. PGB-M46 TaxID=2910255 RepID=UPI001F58A038|nr:GNAT family N-acetyltransferase [Domibacillus sp. PGB-M46]MCI2253208.1 GNAT family N-acetyltransferase [Domibacillus sp. PGB-M46]